MRRRTLWFVAAGSLAAGCSTIVGADFDVSLDDAAATSSTGVSAGPGSTGQGGGAGSGQGGAAGQGSPTSTSGASMTTTSTSSGSNGCVGANNVPCAPGEQCTPTGCQCGAGNKPNQTGPSCTGPYPNCDYVANVCTCMKEPADSCVMAGGGLQCLPSGACGCTIDSQCGPSAIGCTRGACQCNSAAGRGACIAGQTCGNGDDVLCSPCVGQNCDCKPNGCEPP